MPDLPLAPKEIAIEVDEIDGSPLVFYMKPPGHALGFRLLTTVLRGASDDVAKDLGSLDPEELKKRDPKEIEEALERMGSSSIRVAEEDVRELFATSYRRAETASGEALTIGGQSFDPRNRSHYEALPAMYVTSIVSRIVSYLHAIPRDLVGNSNSPDGPSEEGETPSPKPEAGEPVPSSTAT